MQYKASTSLFLFFICAQAATSLLSGDFLDHLQPAYACEAIPAGPPLEELEKSASVFSGKVVEIRRGTMGSESELHVVLFEVDRYWKSLDTNDDYTRLVVFTQPSGDVCGYEFEEGEEYLVYTWSQERDDSLHTGAGTRTRPIDLAQNDLEILGEGREPTRQIGWEEQISKTNFRPIVSEEQREADMTPAIVGGGIFILAGLVVFVVIRRRSRTDSTKRKGEEV